MPCAPPDKSGFLNIDGNSLMVQCIHWNTARSKMEPVPLDHAQGQISAASWARLDNREELGGKLEIVPSELPGLSDTALIVNSYLKWGEACVDHLIGDFVFVIHDRKRRAIICGRDHMGVRPLYYFVSDDVFVCATSLAGFQGLESVPLCVDRKWIPEYLMGLSMSFDRTAYVDIKKLPPAHILTVTAERIHLRPYDQLSDTPALKLNDSREYVDAYKELLETAVKCRMNSDYAIGSESSGGIDSSTITACVARLLGPDLSRLHTFGFAFSELEPRHILAVSRKFHLPNNHIFTGRNKDQDEISIRALSLLGYPVEHGNAISHEPFYRLAEKLDIRTLLSGFGGDEFSTTIHGYLVPLEMIVQRRFRELFNILPGYAPIRFLRMVRLELRRMKSHNFKSPSFNPRFYEAFKQRWPHQIVREDIARHEGLEQRYFENARFDAGYTDLKQFTLEKRWQPFVPTRMENCTLMAAGRKIEYRWPLLDIRLVRFFLSVPSEENFFRGMGRYLHRRAIDKMVPDMITWKKGKDMGPSMAFDTGDIAIPTQFSVPELHPLLREIVDTEKLSRQLKEMPGFRMGNKPDAKGFQFNRNFRSVASVDGWLKYIETHSANHTNFQEDSSNLL